MKYKKSIDIIGTFLLFIGFFLAFLPHAFHLLVGLNEKTPHLKHVITGIYNNDALKYKFRI